MSQVTISGLVVTTPRHLVTQDGLPITVFRMAEETKVWDKALNKLVHGNTNWFTIRSEKQLAINVATSISKGDRIIVSGALKIEDWDNGERAGTSVEIEAATMGHDLVWGSSSYVRTVQVREAE
jgi:single-strand DNA-binding protein